MVECHGFDAQLLPLREPANMVRLLYLIAGFPRDALAPR